MVEKKSEIRLQLQVCVRLVQRDMLIFVRGITRRLINTALWMGMLVYVYEYVGFSTVVGCGLFIVCVECADYGFATVFSSVMRLIGDLKGAKTISYYLTLPLPQYQVFLSLVVSVFLQLMLVASILLPIAKIVLGARFDLSRVSCIKTVSIFICAYLFYASLVLFSTSLIKDIDGFNNFYIRVRDTLFWFGCYLFTWQRLYEKNAVLAYLDLANPFVYACEGMRSAIMGDPTALPLWICCCALLFFAVLCGYTGLRRMMHQLDCL